MAILIVDDSASIREITGDILASAGYSDILTAASGEEAMEILAANKENRIDLILMDMVMPGMGGIEACRMLKESKEHHYIPVIMVTAINDMNRLKLAFDAGVNDYIHKPVNNIELLSRVRAALGLKSEIDKRQKHESELLDLTGELKETNEKLRYFEKAIDNMQMGLTIADPDGKIMYCNPAEAKMHRYSPEELIGKDARIFAPKKLWKPMERKKLKEIGSFRRETTNLRKDGTTFPVQLLSDIVLNDDNEPIAIVTTCDDITERTEAKEALKKAHGELEERVRERTKALSDANILLKDEISERRKVEESLRVSENELRSLFQQFNALLEAIPDSLILFGPDLHILWSNHGAIKIFGLKKKEEPGKPFAIINRIYEDLDEWPVKKCFESGHEESDEISMDDGKMLHIRAFPVIDEKGRVNNVLQFLIDVTKTANLQAEAMKAGHLASIGELSAGVAHEINNPVNGIINCAQLIEKKCEGAEKIEELASMIIKEGKRVAKIVKALLSFARHRGDKLEAMSLEAVLRESLALTEAHLRKDGITLHIDFPEDLPLLTANDQQIEQVFLNLINNARYALNKKYPHDDKKKVLKIKAKTFKRDKNLYVRTVFHDSGPGIEKKVLNKVINPFFTTKPPREGTGLGLSISHGIIIDHGGNLSIDSREGQYTKIIIELPARKEER
ncbi:MAG: response regulator [Deltaproteobacteria bacterium]|nr:response regulator [Deltaproteobacteria bacterium]